MIDRLDALLAQIHLLEKELIVETKKKGRSSATQFTKKSRVYRRGKARNRRFRLSFHRYLLNSRFFVLLTTPVIWMCLIPIVLVDVIGSFYQAICFPIYGIPKVTRGDYLRRDYHDIQTPARGIKKTGTQDYSP